MPKGVRVESPQQRGEVQELKQNCDVQQAHCQSSLRAENVGGYSMKRRNPNIYHNTFFTYGRSFQCHVHHASQQTELTAPTEMLTAML